MFISHGKIKAEKAGQINDMVRKIERQDPPEIIGARLRRLLEALELTSAEFCRRLGITQNRWSPIEAGTKPISKELAIVMRRVFDIPTDWTLLGHEAMLPAHIALKLQDIGDIPPTDKRHRKPMRPGSHPPRHQPPARR